MPSRHVGVEAVAHHPSVERTLESSGELVEDVRLWLAASELGGDDPSVHESRESRAPDLALLVIGRAVGADAEPPPGVAEVLQR